MVLYLDIENRNNEPLTGLGIKFQDNPYKLQPININLNVQGVQLVYTGTSSRKNFGEGRIGQQWQIERRTTCNAIQDYSGPEL